MKVVWRQQLSAVNLLCSYSDPPALFYCFPYILFEVGNCKMDDEPPHNPTYPVDLAVYMYSSSPSPP